MCSVKRTVWITLVDVGGHLNREQDDPVDRGIRGCMKWRNELNMQAFIAVS